MRIAVAAASRAERPKRKQKQRKKIDPNGAGGRRRAAFEVAIGDYKSVNGTAILRHGG
ncbi:hypothetical protein [Paraburkholderia sp.]|jgi:hypothetical protein|uniref:hypothetical protein n=1 Tax=Paraburkholderia sp. TaxID=1926495 RepID=UPI002F42537F